MLPESDLCAPRLRATGGETTMQVDRVCMGLQGISRAEFRVARNCVTGASCRWASHKCRTRTADAAARAVKHLSDAQYIAATTFSPP